MRILITGASGYIGSNLVSYLKGQKHNIVALLHRKSGMIFPFGVEIRKGDFADKRFLIDATEDIDITIHLAGRKGSDKCQENVNEAIDANINFTKNLLEALQKREKRTTIIFSSTYWVYGYKTPVPYHEEYPLMPTDVYGWSKALAETMIVKSGLPYIILRLSNVFGYGIGERDNEVVSLFIKKVISGETITLHNGGKHSIDLILINDVCEIIGRIIELKSKNLVLNVGSGLPTSIFELAGWVNEFGRRLIGKTSPIIKGEKGGDKEEFFDRWVDICRLKRLSGFKPTPLEFSIEKLFQALIYEVGTEKRN